MKRDLVCGISVDPAGALRLDYHGHTYYFCSDRCRREFEDRPDSYAVHQPTSVLEGTLYEPIRIIALALQDEEPVSSH